MKFPLRFKLVEPLTYSATFPDLPDFIITGSYQKLSAWPERQWLTWLLSQMNLRVEVFQSIPPATNRAAGDMERLIELSANDEARLYFYNALIQTPDFLEPFKPFPDAEPKHSMLYNTELLCFGKPFDLNRAKSVAGQAKMPFKISFG